MNEQGCSPTRSTRTRRQARSPRRRRSPSPRTTPRPYFTSWLRQQVVDLYGPGRAFGGGLDVHTTLDLDMQEAAQESAAYNTLAGIAPTASVVVLDNETGGVKAMVGGNDFEEEPFNLATNGHRQPGSSFKPFTLVTALKQGISPSTSYSLPREDLPGSPLQGKESSRSTTTRTTTTALGSLATATIHSDNSVYAELALGHDASAPSSRPRAAPSGSPRPRTHGHRDGPSPTNPAMVLGAYRPGVTPLEMAYAFSTIAHDGERVGGNLDSEPRPQRQPDAAQPRRASTRSSTRRQGDRPRTSHEGDARDPRSVASPMKRSCARSSSGTGELAQTGGYNAWGKTGTTENNGDAWFCGGTEHFTACVWVGHAETNTPMETEYNGGPVDGGTYRRSSGARSCRPSSRSTASSRPRRPPRMTRTRTTEIGLVTPEPRARLEELLRRRRRLTVARRRRWRRRRRRRGGATAVAAPDARGGGGGRRPARGTGGTGL